ncbi:MAG: PIN domain nuclease [Candidatus Omnitrophica bacterium]|nr:PIN domain nuclease [Candidatus Omnitrophota bacterium]
MISLNLVRILFIILSSSIGYLLGGDKALVFFLVSFFASSVIVFFEIMARRVSLKGLSAGVFGIVLGLIGARLFAVVLDLFDIPSEVDSGLKVSLTLIFIYLGLTLGLKGREEFHLIIPYVKFKRQELKEEIVVVDTSSIIDGRILDIVQTGFLEARFIVPRFVLNELHVLADSTEHLKRQKGKRGIEILHSLKGESNIEVIISEQDFDLVKDVDAKVVSLAKVMDARVLTTDYNLNRIAQLEGVKVLNVNDLSNALKLIFIPGEKFTLKLLKEGKEVNQGIGYLEDGTMVVVENARRLIGKSINIEVTSVLQSSSGRIIFAKLAG